MIAAVQREGTCWCGVTVWQGRTAMRVSVISWTTTDADVDCSIEAILRAARSQGANGRRRCDGKDPSLEAGSLRT